MDSKGWKIKIKDVCYENTTISKISKIIEKYQNHGEIHQYTLLYDECIDTDEQVIKVYLDIKPKPLLIGYIPGNFKDFIRGNLKEKKESFIKCENNNGRKYSFFLTNIIKPKSICVEEKSVDLDNRQSIKNINYLSQSNQEVVYRPTNEQKDDYKKSNHSSNNEIFQGYNMENSQKAINLFNFIKGMNEIKKVTITDIDKHMMSLLFKDIPENEEYIHIFSRDRSVQDDVDDNMTILSVKKPIMEPCPKPDPIIEPWLESNWNDFRKSGNYVEEKKFQK